jgi:hypothetical protein
LGRSGPQIIRIGFGSWAVGGGGWAFGWGPQDDAQSLARMRHALELGVNWIDTAAVYGLGHSEELIGRLLRDIRHRNARTSLRNAASSGRARRNASVPSDLSGVVMMKVPLLLSTILALTTMSANGDAQLRLAVSPAQSFAPSNLNIRARLVPSPENRALMIIAESDEFYRSSQIALEGDHAPATITFEFRGVPGGDYIVSAVLTDSVGRRRAIAEQKVSVIEAAGR